MLRIRPFSFWWKCFSCLIDESYYRSSNRRCFERKVFLAISQNSQEYTCARVSFLIKLQASASEKRDSSTMFSCEFCEVSKDTFFTEHLWATTSAIMRTQNLSLQSTFLIKLYQPEENPTVGQISEKEVQCFYIHKYSSFFNF